MRRIYLFSGSGATLAVSRVLRQQLRNMVEADWEVGSPDPGPT